MKWSEVPWQPSTRLLREFAVLWIVFFGSIGWCWNWPAPVLTSGLIWGGLLALGAAGFLFPPLLRPIFVAWMVVAFPIGWCVLHVALAVVYFGVLTPIGCLFRLAGRDLLQIRPSAERSSYWSPKLLPTDVSRYYRTF